MTAGATDLVRQAVKGWIARSPAVMIDDDEVFARLKSTKADASTCWG